jgi:hypothetical protein
MELPVEIVRAGSERVSKTGSGGILFVGDREMEIGGPVEYVVTLAAGNNGTVNLRCMGKVLRLEKSSGERTEDQPVVVAVSLERYEFQRSNGHAQAEAV